MYRPTRPPAPPTRGMTFNARPALSRGTYGQASYAPALGGIAQPRRDRMPGAYGNDLPEHGPHQSEVSRIRQQTAAAERLRQTRQPARGTEPKTRSPFLAYSPPPAPVQRAASGAPPATRQVFPGAARPAEPAGSTGSQRPAAQPYKPVFPPPHRTSAKITTTLIGGPSDFKFGDEREIRVTVTGGTLRDLYLHVVTASPVYRMPKVVRYPLIETGDQEIYGKGKVKIPPSYKSRIPHTGDQYVFVTAAGSKVSPTYSMPIKAAIKGADYGDKISLLMAERRIELKTDKMKTRRQRLNKVKDKAKRDLLAVKAVAGFTLMVETVLPQGAVSDGTRVPPEALKSAETVVIEAIADLKLERTFLATIPGLVGGIGPMFAAGSGVVKLAMAAFYAYRVHTLRTTGRKIGEYPEYTYSNKAGAALFDRISQHYAQRAWANVKQAAGKFVEAAVRIAIPGSAQVVGTATLAHDVYSKVLAKAFEIYVVDLTNNMLHLAERARTAEGFYDVVGSGHITVPAYVANRYSAKDLSGARRVYMGYSAQAKVLWDGAADLQKYCKAISDASDFRVVGPL